MSSAQIERVEAVGGITKYVESQLRTGTWETLNWLNQKASRVNFMQVERDLAEPKQAQIIRAQTWRAKLEERMTVLGQVNQNKIYSIEVDEQGENATGQEALFEIGDTKKRVMWSGTTLTLAQSGIKQEGSQTQVPVYPISYSEWIACYNPAYTKAFKEAGLPLPYAGVGVSVLMVTPDELIPLTRRGIETPVYPGRLYSPGGGPKPGQTSVEAILEEIIEETGLEEGIHFDSANMFALAMVSDIHFAGSEHSRPELLAYLSVNVPFRELQRIQYETANKKGKHEQDVWAVEPCSAVTPTLANTIIYHGPEMCPPTEAGLAHLLLYREMHEEGLSKALENIDNTMRKLGSFRRTEFKPLIERLARA